jgi:hypothetical protein
VPVNGRYANKDTTLPRGGGPDGKSKIFVPKGSACEYSVHVMHHRKDSKAYTYTKMLSFHQGAGMISLSVYLGRQLPDDVFIN